MQLVEQGLEFIVGDQVAAARTRHRGRRRGGDAAMHVELGDQFGRGKARLGARRHRVKHRLQVVQ